MLSFSAVRRPVSRRSEPEELLIERIGADGDGVAEGANGAVYLPLTLPGERVRARIAGRQGVAESILEPSAARVAPACPHFGACGGCSLQHWREEAYAVWKASLLETALQRAGFADPPLRQMVRGAPGTRRRMDLALARHSGRVRVGLHRAGGAEVVDLTTCLVANPAIVGLIAPLRALLGGAGLLRREGSAIINLLESGPDLLLRTDAEPSPTDRITLTSFARAHSLLRVAWARGNGAPEPVCVLRPPVVTLGGVSVTPPPGAFLQASADGERAILRAVLEGLPARMSSRACIVELYAGCGTLTFALATRARIAAFEGDPGAIAALRAGANAQSLAGRIVAHVRDLARQPLTRQELAGASAVVLDPPYAGAAVQMPALAAARPERIVYVSCNPAALARDAGILRQARYALLAATPIDQFLWSARLESVCVFVRP